MRHSHRSSGPPPGVLGLARLVRLDVRDNALPALPPALSSCASLAELFAGRNPLSARSPLSSSLPSCPVVLAGPPALPPADGVLTPPTYRSPRIQAPNALPPELSALSALRTLDLSEARLSRFPAELCALRLATLDLSNNDLAAVPPELGRMTSLRRVALGGNPIKAIRQALVNGPTPALLEHLVRRRGVIGRWQRGGRFSYVPWWRRKEGGPPRAAP